MDEVLFTVKLTYEGEKLSMDFPSIVKFMDDPGLPDLFVDDKVSDCVVFVGKKRITGHPLMTWKKLKDQVLSSSQTILRLRYDNRDETATT